MNPIDPIAFTWTIAIGTALVMWATSSRRTK